MNEKYKKMWSALKKIAESNNDKNLIELLNKVEKSYKGNFLCLKNYKTFEAGQYYDCCDQDANYIVMKDANGDFYEFPYTDINADNYINLIFKQIDEV